MGECAFVRSVFARSNFYHLPEGIVSIARRDCLIFQKQGRYEPKIIFTLELFHSLELCKACDRNLILSNVVEVNINYIQYIYVIFSIIYKIYIWNWPKKYLWRSVRLMPNVFRDENKYSSPSIWKYCWISIKNIKFLHSFLKIHISTRPMFTVDVWGNL